MTGVTDGYVITERRSITEWGAGSEVFEVAIAVMNVAWPAIVGNAAWAFLKLTVDRIGQAVGEPPRVPSDEEIQASACYRVAMRYEDSGDAGDLEVLETRSGTTPDGFEWSVTLRGPGGTKYAVEKRANSAFSMTRTERSVDRVSPKDHSV